MLRLPIRKALLLIPLFTLFACASVKTHVDKGDYNSARKLCEEKPDQTRQTACFEEFASLIEGNQVDIAYDIYMDLGNKSGNVSYYKRAGDLTVDHKDIKKPLKAFEKVSDDDTKKLLLNRSTMIGILNTGLRDYEWERYANQFGLKEIFMKLAAKNAHRDPLDSARLYELAGKPEKAAKLRAQARRQNAKILISKGRYAQAAKIYEDMGDTVTAQEYYVKAAKRTLTRYKFNYQTALDLFEKGGQGEEGKKLVVEALIKNKRYESSLTVAKSISPELYQSTLVSAAEMAMSRKSGVKKAIELYREAGVKDPYAKIARHYLNRKNPDFYSASGYFTKSTVQNYKSELLTRAIEIDDKSRIKQYAKSATKPEQHEQVGLTLLKDYQYQTAYDHFQLANLANAAILVAEQAVKNNSNLIAGKYFYLGGAQTEAFENWNKGIDKVIDQKDSLESYLTTFKDVPEELSDIFWERVLNHFKETHPTVAKAPVVLKDNYPILALGFIHNMHQADLHTKWSLKYLKEGQPNRSRQHSVRAAVHLQMNNFLSYMIKENGYRYPIFDTAFKEISQAQIASLNDDFTKMSKHLNKAKAEFDRIGAGTEQAKAAKR